MEDNRREFIEFLKDYQRSLEVQPESLELLMRQLESHVCCFIVSGNQLFPANENLRATRRLEAEMRASNLTHFKLREGFPKEPRRMNSENGGRHSFMVVNNRYVDTAFEKLCVSWCEKYNRSSILITHPLLENSTVKRIDGAVFNRYGKRGDAIIARIALEKIEQYVSEERGKERRLLSADMAFESEDRNVCNVNSRRLSEIEFFDLYPELSEYRGC